MSDKYLEDVRRDDEEIKVISLEDNPLLQHCCDLIKRKYPGWKITGPFCPGLPDGETFKITKDAETKWVHVYELLKEVSLKTLVMQKEIMKTTTNIYRQDKHIRSEKACTLKEWVQMGRLAPGQSILIGDVKDDNIGREIHSNTETIIIGHATPYVQPTTASEEGWDFANPRMSKTVLEVHLMWGNKE